MADTMIPHYNTKNRVLQLDSISLLETLFSSFLPSIIPGSSPSVLASTFDKLIISALSSDLTLAPYNLSRRYKNLSLEEGEKGIPFPTIISKNEFINDFSGSSEPLQKGDLVHFGASVHLNGFPAYKTISFILQVFI